MFALSIIIRFLGDYSDNIDRYDQFCYFIHNVLYTMARSNQNTNNFQGFKFIQMSIAIQNDGSIECCEELIPL